MLRNRDLCPGPSECPEVLNEDPYAKWDAPPCLACPLTLLREYLASPGGLLINLVVDLDYAIQSGIKVPLGEITYPEFLLLRQLTEERNKFEAEELKKRRS
jgi:hypothetical protein